MLLYRVRKQDAFLRLSHARDEGTEVESTAKPDGNLYVSSTTLSTFWGRRQNSESLDIIVSDGTADLVDVVYLNIVT